MRDAGLTIAELASLLDPPVTLDQVKYLVRVLKLEQTGVRKTKQPGRPAPTYNAKIVMQEHEALSP